MKPRHCSEPEDAAFIEGLLSRAVNLVSLTYAQIYLPTYSNGLKEIGRYLGFRWSDPEASGVAAMVWRSAWELSRDSALKQRLLTYNAEDCEATQKLAEQLSGDAPMSVKRPREQVPVPMEACGGSQRSRGPRSASGSA